MKTKKAMKKITNIGMAALVAMGMLGTSCNKAESPEIETPETQKENIVTLTTTVGFAADGTKALTGTGVKTFAEDDKIAVIYENTSGTMVKAETAALTANDITAEGKSATFTVTLTAPKASGAVKYIYPAAMAGETDVDYTKLNSQDGTLDNLGKKLDLAVFEGNLTAEAALPATASLENRLAILAITLKDEAGENDITGSTTKLTVSDGINTYDVNRSVAEGPIYVAIFPTADATITVTATGGTKNYAKTLTTKTYEAGNGYPVTWKMTKVVHYSSEINVPAGDHWYISGSSQYNNITIGEDATVTIVGLLQMEYASIICSGNATIILADGTTTKRITNGRIKAGPEGTTLTIKGNTVKLDIDAFNSSGAAIGASDGDACGNIVIEGGVITAKGANAAGIGGASNAKCGNITISGGIVTATGSNGAGIGASTTECGNITISGGTIEATGGSGGAGIGLGVSWGSCKAITISGGTVKATGSYGAPGIGGVEGVYESITITGDVTKVTAIKGSSAQYSIGINDDYYWEYCGPITIGGTVYFQDGNFTNNDLMTSQFVYQP